MNHNLNYKYNPSPLQRGPEDYRLTAQTAGTYITGFSPIIPQQNSTHDINKAIPAAPTGMYQQSTGAIPGPTPQHHQPGIGGPSPTAAMVQGQQQMNRTHLANMGAFPPRNNPPQISSIPRPPMTNIVQHGGPQASQAYQPIQNVVLSHGHPPQLFQHFPIQMPAVYQQRSMQYPLQQCPPQQIFTPYNYSTPAAPNSAYFHVSPCPPAVNNIPPQNQQSQIKREKKMLEIIDPDTGKNVMEDLNNDSSRESSRSASIHPSRENSRVGDSNPDVCSMFATQVAAKIKLQEPESKVISNSQPPDVVLESCSKESSNGDIAPPVICDSYAEKEIDQNSNVSFSKCDRIEANSISDNIKISISEHKDDFKPVEKESYDLVNHDSLNSVKNPSQDYASQNISDAKSFPAIPRMLDTSQNIEIANSNNTSAIKSELILNCVEEVKIELTDINLDIGTEDSVTHQATLKNEKPVEGKKSKGKKRKETINKKGDSKEGSEMDAFLVTDSEFVLQAVVSSSPSSIVSVPEDIQNSTSPLLSLEAVTIREAAESISISLKENESLLDEDADVKEASAPNEQDDVETSVINTMQEISKVPLLKYAYKEDQWSPLNPEGKKHYDREFLIQMQSQPISLKKPLNLPNLDVIKDKAQIYKINDVRNTPGIPIAPPRSYQGPFDPFMPNYARGGVARQSPHGGLGRRSQQGRDKPKKVISFSSSLNQSVKLHESSNAWKPQSVKSELDQDDDNKNQEVYKKVRGILNKLTPQKFETLVKQVKELEINTEERLKNVIDLVFDKAVDEPNFSVPYANMCKQLALLKVPLADQDGYVNFRKLLLTKCQKEFEQDRNEELNKEEKLKQIAEATVEEQRKQLKEDFEEEERKSRRRQLGNIRFIGELFKLGMLTELIMHECVKKLISQGDEDSLECLCRLLTTIGKELEYKRDGRKDGITEDAKFKTSLMSDYMTHMQKIVDDRQTSSRVRFMLQDVIDLKKNNWKPRRNDDNPKTIDQIHKEAEKEAQEQQQLLQNMSFPAKRLTDSERKRSSANRTVTYDGSTEGGWTTTNKTSKLNLDPHKLTLSRPVEVDTITLGPGGGRGFSSWGRGSSGGNKGNMESDRSAILTNKYSVLANESMPVAQPGLEVRRNSQKSAASSRESSIGRNSQLPPQSLQKTPSTSKERENVLETVSRLARPMQTEQKPVEPKVPNMSNLNGKESCTAVLELRGPELSEDEIEKRTRPLMDEFLHNVDFKEAIRCITEIASTSTVHLLITAAINHVLERSSQARYLLGQLLHTLVQSKIVMMDQYNNGLKSILELVDDYALDIPLIWDYLGEILEPMLGSDILLTFLQDTLKPFSPSLTAAKLVAAVLHCVIKKRGMAKVQELWRESELQWSFFLNSQDLAEFLKTNKLEFTIDQIETEETSEMLSGAELQEKLDVYLRNDSQNDEQIFDWIESHVGDKISEPIFIRALVTSIFENTIIGPVEKCELSTEKLKARLPIIQHYISSKDAELQTLYALQALLVRLKQPKGILNQIFNFLYDEEIISEEAFCAWENSTDSSEQEGKGVALNSVSPFFSWLREAENDESADDG